MKFFTLEKAITAAALLFFTFSFSQEKIVIELIVDIENFDETNLSSSCSLKATYSKSGKVIESGDDLVNFTVPAKLDDIIVWEGVALNSDADDIIDIKKIMRANESKIFKSRRNYGKRSAQLTVPKEIVECRIMFSTENKADYKYSIFFKINKGRTTYEIDPKIKVGSTLSRDSDRN